MQKSDQNAGGASLAPGLRDPVEILRSSVSRATPLNGEDLLRDARTYLDTVLSYVQPDPQVSQSAKDVSAGIHELVVALRSSPPRARERAAELARASVQAALDDFESKLASATPSDLAKALHIW